VRVYRCPEGVASRSHRLRGNAYIRVHQRHPRFNSPTRFSALPSGFVLHCQLSVLHFALFTSESIRGLRIPGTPTYLYLVPTASVGMHAFASIRVHSWFNMNFGDTYLLIGLLIGLCYRQPMARPLCVFPEQLAKLPRAEHHGGRSRPGAPSRTRPQGTVIKMASPNCCEIPMLPETRVRILERQDWHLTPFPRDRLAPYVTSCYAEC